MCGHNVDYYDDSLVIMGIEENKKERIFLTWRFIGEVEKNKSRFGDSGRYGYCLYNEGDHESFVRTYILIFIYIHTRQTTTTIE